MTIGRRSTIAPIIACILGSVFLLGLAQPVQALNAPEGYVRTVANKLVSTITADGSASDFDGLVLRYTDVQTIARFCLGKYRKGLAANQEKEYYALAKGYIARFLRANAASFKNAKVQIIGSHPWGKSTVIVKSKVIYADGGGVLVNWRVVKRGAGYRIFDVKVKGVSLVISLKTSFTSHISKNQGKVSALIEHLRR